MTEKSREKTKNLLLEALASSPNVEFACKKVGIGRATYYRWREDSEEFEEEADLAIAQGRSRINDLAESKLISLIHSEHFPAIKYWLEHNKSRYIRKKKEIISFRRPFERTRLFSLFKDDDS